MYSNGDNGQRQIQVSGQRPASKEQVAFFFSFAPQNRPHFQGDTDLILHAVLFWL